MSKSDLLKTRLLTCQQLVPQLECSVYHVSPFNNYKKSRKLQLYCRIASNYSTICLHVQIYS